MGFKETFTRSGEQDSNLQYDDTAFLYFSLSFLLLLLIPLIYNLLRQVLLNDLQEKQRMKGNKYLTAKFEEIKKIEKYDKLNRFLLLKLVLLVILIVSLYENILKLGQVEGTIKSFDPYETLGVDLTSSVQEIKKAYRKLSLVYHPDKNRDDPLATAKFILITKAYNCLTDETMKSKCEKYGNPDGPGSFSVAVALPSFLLKKQNHVLVLIMFFVLFLIIIPTIVYLWYIDQAQFDHDGILLENKRNYYKYLNENTIFKQIPEILSLSVQFSKYPVLSQEEGLQLQKLSQIIYDEHNIIKPKLDIQSLKPFILIHSHIFNLKLTHPVSHQQYRILKESRLLMQQLIEFTSKIPPNVNNVKYCGLRCVNNLIDFQQCLAQGLQQSSFEIEQLQFFKDKTRVDLIQKKVKKVPNLQQIIEKDEACQKLLSMFTQQSIDEIYNELNMFPQYKVMTKVLVEDEEQLVEGDIVSIKCDIYRLNLLNSEQITDDYVKMQQLLMKKEASFVYNPANPVLYNEGIHVILADVRRNLILFQKHLIDQKGFLNTTIQFRAPFQGQYQWTLFIRSDSYKGFDLEMPINFYIQSIKSVKREVYVHPEDQALDREPSFMQQLMQGAGLNQSDDELEDEQEEINRLKQKLKAQKQQNGEEFDDENEEIEEEEDKEEEEEVKKIFKNSQTQNKKNQ